MRAITEISLEILRCIIRDGQLRRREFASAHGYRPASVLEAVNELKRNALVIEPGRTGTKTGRRSPELSLNPNMGAFVGMELQPARILGCVIDGAGNLLASESISYPEGIEAGNARSHLCDMFSALKSALRDCKLIYQACGFADPGLVDLEKQLSLQAVNVPGWKNLDVAAWLREITAIENVYIIPETMARAFAEYNACQPDAPSSLFQISLNSGIGGGFIKNGEMFVGDTGRAMEIGHLVVTPNGPQCQCGNRGCLEAVAGQHGIRGKVMEMLANGVITELSPESFSLSAFSAAVRNRDRAAMLLAMDICECIASSLASVVTLLNPSAIVISGDLTGMGDMLLDTVKRTLALRCFPGATDILKVEYSRLDAYAAAYAAAITVRNRFLTQRR